MGVDLLSDGQIKGAPILVTTLFVGRNGIMDLCFYAIVSEVLLEFVATKAEYGEDVIDAVASGLDYPHEGIAYFSLITSSNLLATLIVSVEMFQFYGKDGGLDFVDAGVIAAVVVNVFLVAAIVAEGTDDVSQLLVVGSDSSSIA